MEREEDNERKGEGEEEVAREDEMMRPETL